MTNKKTKTKYEKKSVDSGNMCYDAQLTSCTFIRNKVILEHGVFINNTDRIDS